MKQQQAGFTLIELIMVIVILGILAATALPKFIDLQDESYHGQAVAVAGAISSWSAMNYGVSLASAGARGEDVTGTDYCTSALSQIDTDVTDITVAAGTGTCTGAGDQLTCTVAHDKGPTGVTANATLICTAAP